MHSEFTRRFESGNVSRDNVSREIGRNAVSTFRAGSLRRGTRFGVLASSGSEELVCLVIVLYVCVHNVL